jgi:predicted metalloprotease
VAIAGVGCWSTNGPVPGSSGLGTSDRDEPTNLIARADPIVCAAASSSESPVGTSPAGPPNLPPVLPNATPFGPPGESYPSGMPPPPLVPPEALADLNRLAGFVSDLSSPVKAGDDGSGIIYIGEGGVEEIGNYMDRVMDNLVWFWRTVLSDSGKLCAWEVPRGTWIPIDGFATSPCGAADASEAAGYCGNAGSGMTGEITVGELWMFDDIYQRFDDHAEFAVASVLAHEMGHHMQDVFGYLRDTYPRRCCGLRALNIELHADCLGGVWATSIYGRREIDLATMTQAVRAAEDFADTPQPGELTDRGHGTAEERRHWYLAGFESGKVSACDGALTAQP